MKKSPVRITESATRTDTGSKILIPTLVAVGGGLAALPAAALELGDVKVESSLGQPLRASIAYALAPNEALYDTCVSLQRATPGGDLPSVSRASIRIANGLISITGRSIIREPLMSMRVNIRCPYTPQLSRDYMLFVDPARPAPNTTVEPAAAAAVTRPVTAQATPAPVPARRRQVSRDPIGTATRYRVQPGDSLSLIAQRIENRPIGLWDAVATIFAANPDAFIDDDPNKLKAGSWLDIPDFGAGEPMTVAADNVFSSAPAESAAPTATAYPGVAGGQSAAAEPAADVTPAPIEASDQAVEVIDTALTRAPSADLQPGDIILDSDNPFVATGDDSVVIPDTLLPGPESTSSSPNVPTATIQPAEQQTASANWLLWLVGSGLAIIAALILFGRTARGRFGSTPIGAIETPQRRRTDGNTLQLPVVEEPTIEVEEFLSIADDSPTEENLALDADLVIGTGLTESADVDVAQDFGFAATTGLDLELPEEMSSGAPQLPETDIIPPLHVDPESILESEVLPGDGTDDYDMSVIMDATKMPRPEDVTEKDLGAVAVETSDEPPIADEYSVSQEADYSILEQDYEEELTATQALNVEISRAAADLAARMEGAEADSAEGATDTSEISLASVTALDVTAQLPAKNDDDIDADEAAATASLTSEEKTVEMSADDKTVEMGADDKTVEMPSRDSEKTVAMDIKPGRTGTKGR